MFSKTKCCKGIFHPFINLIDDQMGGVILTRFVESSVTKALLHWPAPLFHKGR